MIVWGGITTGGSVNTGGRYNPPRTSWTATSTATNVPAARFSATGGVDGSEMIVWGGNRRGPGAATTRRRTRG